MALTIFFAIGCHNVVIKTIFSDLLPANHPYTQVFLDHPNFGSPLSVTIMVQNKNGTIYDPEFLQTVWDITRDLDLAPAVNHNTVLSITTPSARFAEATPYGINMRPLMGDHPPATPEEVKAFKVRLSRSPNSRGFLVSRDETAAIVTASFIEANLKYGELFKFVRGLAKKYRDENTAVYIAGQPMLTGWVYHYQFQMLLIFGVTIGALFLALWLYMRNIAGTLTPILTGLMSTIWGFGLTGWFQYLFQMAVEPLL
ncbi:MAG: MMPL family transporter, partial [Salinisphaera sp.]|nr:MMPL family transporter [Salinisphaera sp.]